MDTGIIRGGITGTDLISKAHKANEVTGIPVDTFSASAPQDSAPGKMKLLAALNSRKAAEILLNNDKEKHTNEVLSQLSIWQDKKGHTSNTDAVYDGVNKTLYTGVEPKGPSDFNYWHLRAYNPDGSEKWTFRGEYVESTPVLDGEGNIYVRSRNKLHILDKNGSEKSSIPIQRGDWSDSPPALGPNGEIYFVAGNPDRCGSQETNLRLYAYKDGKELWHYDASGDYTGDPQVLVGQNGTVYLATERHRWARSFGGLLKVDHVETPALIGINPKNGSEKFVAKVSRWDSYVKGQIAEGPDGTIYACHGAKNLTAYSPKGKKKWSFKVTDRVNVNHTGAYSRFFQPPTFDKEGNLYVGTTTTSIYPEGYLICLDKNGNEKWNTPVQGGINTMAKIGPDGKLYCGAGSGDLLVFDPKTGQQINRFPIGKFYTNNFSFGDNGEMYLNTDERVIAFYPDPAKAKDKTRQGDLEEAKSGDTPEAAGPAIEVEDEFVNIDGMRLPKHLKLLYLSHRNK